jgi:hypothetical protein
MPPGSHLAGRLVTAGCPGVVAEYGNTYTRWRRCDEHADADAYPDEHTHRADGDADEHADWTDGDQD